MRRFGYPHELFVTGWAMCEKKEYQSRELKKVLFAPIHPNHLGNIAPCDYEANRRAFEILLGLPIDLTVRHIGPLDKGGLWYADGVKYIGGNTCVSTHDIDKVDLVVSTQTFLWLSVARGVPALSMGENIQPHSIITQDEVRWVEHWDKYREYMAYPLDLLQTDDPLGLMQRACRTDRDIRDWKKRFIGDAFNPSKFVQKVESYL